MVNQAAVGSGLSAAAVFAVRCRVFVGSQLLFHWQIPSVSPGCKGSASGNGRSKKR
jgi:hypothetical protein